MTFVANLLWILLFVAFAQTAEKTPAPSPLERLRARIPVTSVGPVDTTKLAGHYANPPRDLIKRIGGVLDGNDLYLFPDGTFIYCEWSDISPSTIYDKGKWELADGAVELKSDQDVTWNPGVDRTYVALRRRSHENEIFLIGAQRDLSHFEEDVHNDPEFALLVACKERKETFTRVTGERVKAKLLRESWRPDFVTSGRAK